MQTAQRDADFQLIRVQVAQAAGYDDSKESWGGAWALAGVLVGGKILIVVALLALAPTRGMLVLMAAYNWTWVVLLVALGSGPMAFGWRLVRARRRRDELVRSEWHVD